MKNVIRAFALSLVVTGAFASSHINASTVGGKVSAMPVPQCEPTGKTDCGMCRNGYCSVR